jgi:hypothetical protein
MTLEVKMSEIMKFSGFKTSDGETFQTKAKALEHMNKRKIEDAISKYVGSEASFIPTSAAELASLLLADRERIQACYNVKVRQRAPRKPSKKEAKKEAATQFAASKPANSEGQDVLDILKGIE